MGVVMHGSLPTKTVNGIEFNDVREELYRVYTFTNGEVKVDAPLWLNVSKSGGHRIIVSDNSVVYIPSGWLKLQWFTKDGSEPIQF